MLHFTLFVTTGRFKKSFIEGHWPEHDARPPATPKLLHAVHMISMIILGFTGMYLRFPFFVSNRVIMRNIHYVFMIIVIVILVWRVWYAFFSKTNADWREFAIGKKDLDSDARRPGVLRLLQQQQAARRQVQRHAEDVLQRCSSS